MIQGKHCRKRNSPIKAGLRILALSIMTLMSAGIMMYSCSDNGGISEHMEAAPAPSTIPDTTHNTNKVNQDPPPADSVVTIMVLPCANGYDYATSNYDLEKVLVRSLQNIPACRVVPVPYSKLKGKGYNGVFRIEDCSWVIQHSDVAYLMLSRIEGELLSMHENENGHWGYRTRLVNTRTNMQSEFIADHDLKRFTDIENSVNAKLPQAWQDYSWH